jgi:hypothetical protein
MIELTLQEKYFDSQIVCTIGGKFPVHVGDHITINERFDGLWEVSINDQPTGFAIDAFYVNLMAGCKFIGA